MRVLQRPLSMAKSEQENRESVEKCHKTPGFSYSKADTGLETSAECGKPALYSVKQRDYPENCVNLRSGVE